ncbi:S9 family peptidase [Sphingomonas crusticola]|uniref:S9 family peptidase n=1 Tax=Sphingomonas crusticola TaxID=1697973 RepID=UPI000E2813C9|nr:S9 family peptidase [Sphingomonas crusticola]
MRLLFASAAILTLAAPALAQPPSVPLIERAKLFGNPSKTAGRLSPDGRWLAWIAPRDGVLNIWVAPVADPAAAKPLTAEKTRPIRSYYWSPDSKTILFVNDKGGDENFLLYGVDVATAAQKSLTPFDKTRVEVINISRAVKDRILIGINNRDPRWHDVYGLDLATGKLSLVLQNDGGYAGFVADEQLVPRLATKQRPDGGQSFYRVTGGKVEQTPFATIGLDDSLTTGPSGFTTDGKTLYWLDSRGRDTAALIAQDVASGRQTIVAQDPRADIDGVLADPKTGVVQAWSVNYLRDDWIASDPAIGKDLAWLKKELKGDIAVTSRTDADNLWTVAVDPVTAPSATYLFDRRTRSLKQLYVGRPELVGAPLVPMYPEAIPARDGMTLVSYLTLPAGSDPDGDGKPSHPVPLVLFVHGGPWARDAFGYNSWHQWLANRGYAVLSVNYRGSTGFGKKFISAGDLQWGRKMHDDLLDAVGWAVRQGVTTSDKVAIAGGSYGGYATLAGVAFTPDAFRCGVDIVGPSNLFTLLQTIPPYWEAGKQQFYKRMGDPTTDVGKALLRERSPLFMADKIKVPLLIGQGQNDPRVNVRESQQIVDAMKAKNIPVTYVVFPDEGHGFARPVNNIAFNAITENFLAACLGGRAEPIGDALKPSSAQVKEGADQVHGLAAAVAAP